MFGMKKKYFNPYTDIYVKRLGHIGIIRVYAVEAGKVRKRFYNHFSRGGHDRIYSWIPVNEIWVDSKLNKIEIKSVVKELLEERKQMGDGLRTAELNKPQEIITTKVVKKKGLLGKILGRK